MEENDFCLFQHATALHTNLVVSEDLCRIYLTSAFSPFPRTVFAVSLKILLSCSTDKTTAHEFGTMDVRESKKQNFLRWVN